MQPSYLTLTFFSTMFSLNTSLLHNNLYIYLSKFHRFSLAECLFPLLPEAPAAKMFLNTIKLTPTKSPPAYRGDTPIAAKHGRPCQSFINTYIAIFDRADILVTPSIALIGMQPAKFSQAVHQTASFYHELLLLSILTFSLYKAEKEKSWEKIGWFCPSRQWLNISISNCRAKLFKGWKIITARNSTITYLEYSPNKLMYRTKTLTMLNVENLKNLKQAFLVLAFHDMTKSLPPSPDTSFAFW